MKTKLTTFILLGILMAAIVFTGCKKKEKLSVPKPIEWGSMTDVEGNTYKTVKIGSQWWMAENLRVTKYRNGTPIKHMGAIDPDSVWSKATQGYYCRFQEYHTTTDFSDVYGMLYNWYAVNDTGLLAPEGWHVATDNDWKQLETEMGMSQSDANGVNWRGSDQANKLKLHSPDGWVSYGSLWSDNASGFTALAGACRLFDGRWADPNIQYCGFWWTSSTHPGNKAWFRNLDYKKTNVFRYYTYKTYGMSVRCVKD